MERKTLEAAPRHWVSKLKPIKAYVRSRLEEFDLPATVLLRERQSKGYTGGIAKGPRP